MSTNWKKYRDDPRYLIALLPGLEIAIANLEEERDSIREAISQGLVGGGAESDLLTKLEQPKALPAPRKQRGAKAGKKARYQRRVPEITSSAHPLVQVTEDMNQAEFLTAVIRKLGGRATNDQLRAAAATVPKFHKLASGVNLSVAVTAAIKKGAVTRVAPGTIAEA